MKKETVVQSSSVISSTTELLLMALMLPKTVDSLAMDPTALNLVAAFILFTFFFHSSSLDGISARYSSISCTSVSTIAKTETQPSTVPKTRALPSGVLSTDVSSAWTR